MAREAGCPCRLRWLLESLGCVLYQVRGLACIGFGALKRVLRLLDADFSSLEQYQTGVLFGVAAEFSRKQNNYQQRVLHEATDTRDQLLKLVGANLLGAEFETLVGHSLPLLALLRHRFLPESDHHRRR